MQDTILTIYCLCDDLLKAMNHQDDPQTRFSSAEVMCVPVIACAYFGGNMARTRAFLFGQGYFKVHLSASRFSRRLKALPDTVWHSLFGLLSQVFQQHNQSGAYVVDSFPVPVCHNIRIKRCKLFPAEHKESFRGYCASKKSYFFGFKVQLLITAQGEPVEFVLTPGSMADQAGFRHLNLDLPAGSVIHADKGYNDYGEEDLLWHAGELLLKPLRKSNSKRAMPPWVEFVSKPVRQQVETAISQITALFPKHIHAVTAQGLQLKLMCFVLAYAISCL
jgi:hypothetical protein